MDKPVREPVDNTVDEQELRQHATMYRADAARIAAAPHHRISHPDRPDRETNI